MSAATKIDYRKQLSELYRPPKTPVIVEVPELEFLMIDGAGDPNTAPEYQAAVKALYSMSYAIKFALRHHRDGFDYSVMPLEGLWWSGDPVGYAHDKGSWSWTLMIMQPEQTTEEMFTQGLAKSPAKDPLPTLEKLRLEQFREGLSVLVMHIGPYADEAPTIEVMHAFADEHGYIPRGKHHEIYLSDPRRVVPEKMKTVIRHPIEVRPS